jgi:putative heme-binding domain-containing protein
MTPLTFEATPAGMRLGWRVGNVRRAVRRLAGIAAVVLSVSAPLSAGEPPSREAYRKFALANEGDAEAGWRLFNDAQKVACAVCHTVDGKGGKAGPDLFAIGEKFGRRDLIQQVLEPSATIAVGYSTTVVRTKDGELLHGVVTDTGNESIGLTGADGRLTRIRTIDIAAKRTTDISMMPEGLEQGLTRQQFADLITYLTTLKPPQSTAAAHQGQPSEIPPLKTPVTLRQFNSDANRFQHPVWFGAVPGLKDAFLVAEHETGTVWLFRKNESEESKTPFLQTGRNDRGASGVLGLCFHPRFAENHKYYLVKHTVDGKGFATRVLQGVVAADLRSDSGEPLKEVFTIQSMVNDHPGGSLAFGPDDGCLYVGMGDSGPHHDPNGNGQNLSILQGKIHRIDVDHPDAGKGYSIPKDNPFVGRPGVRPEIWSYGHREPWRFSFDPVTRELYVGNIGQDLYDEVEIVRKGENHGWNVMEGFERFSNEYRRDGETFTPPVFAYGRKYGQSVTGGFVYRGDPRSSFYGVYVFADYQQKRVFGLTQKDRKLEKVRLLVTSAPQSVVSIGQDAAGELYLVGYEGNLYKLDLASSRWE